MKASDMIKQLEGLIKEHGDLPMAFLEIDTDSGKHCFIEASHGTCIYELENDEVLYDEYDEPTKCKKVFLLD